MAITEREGFKFLDDRMIVIEDNRIDEYIEYILENKIKSVYLCSLYFKDKGIDFFHKINFIENLNITSWGIKSYEVLQELKCLRSLSIEEPEFLVDLRYNKSLEELAIVVNKNVVGFEQLTNLKKLRVWKYNPKSKSLSELGGLNFLQELQITDSSIESFSGCESLTHLKNMQLNYLKKMCYIDELEKINNNLRILEFNSCKKLINHDYVSYLSNLEKLAFNECSDIQTIDFIRKMKNLKSFVFMKTNVCDGKLECCKDLEYVAFTNKKHFSHKLRDFMKE